MWKHSNAPDGQTGLTRRVCDTQGPGWHDRDLWVSASSPVWGLMIGRHYTYEAL
jgi:hypothetical protein